MVGPLVEIPLLARPSERGACNREGSTQTEGKHGAGLAATPGLSGQSAQVSLGSTLLPRRDSLSKSLDSLVMGSSPRRSQPTGTRAAVAHGVPADHTAEVQPRDRAPSGLVDAPLQSWSCEGVTDNSLPLSPITINSPREVTPMRAGDRSKPMGPMTERAGPEAHPVPSIRRSDSSNSLVQSKTGSTGSRNKNGGAGHHSRRNDATFLKRGNINRIPDQWDGRNARRQGPRSYSKDYGQNRDRVGEVIQSPKSRREAVPNHSRPTSTDRAQYEAYRAKFPGSGDGHPGIPNFGDFPQIGGEPTGVREAPMASLPSEDPASTNAPTTNSSPGAQGNPSDPGSSGDSSGDESSGDNPGDPPNAGGNGDPPGGQGGFPPGGNGGPSDDPDSSGDGAADGSRRGHHRRPSRRGQPPPQDVAGIVAALGDTMLRLQQDSARRNAEHLVLYSRMMKDTLNDAIKPAYDAIPVIGTAMQAMQCQANERTGKLIGVPLFSGDTDNDKLPSAERARIEPNVAVFAERIQVAVDVPHLREVDKVRQLHLHLRGSASEQLLMRPQDGVHPNTFAELLALIRWTFQPADLHVHQLRELMHAKRGKNESLHCYLIRLKRLRIKVSNSAPHFDEGLDLVVYNALIRGINPDIIASLETQTRIQYNDFESIVAYIKKYSLLHSAKAPHGLGPSKSYLDGKDSPDKGRMVSACGSLDTGDIEPAVSMVSADSLCFQCHRPGHLARDCSSGAQTQTITKPKISLERRGPAKTKEEFGKKSFEAKKGNTSLSCIVCRKPGHIARQCFVHKRSVALIKRRFEAKREEPPKEIYAAGLVTNESTDSLRKELRDNIDWEGYEDEDIEHAITCSLTLHSQMNGLPENSAPPTSDCSEEEA